MTITPEKLRAAAATGSPFAAVEAGDCEMLAMAIELADAYSRHAVLEACCVRLVDGGIWYDTDIIEPPIEIDYLIARNLIERHPRKPGLVRFVNNGGG